MASLKIVLPPTIFGELFEVEVIYGTPNNPLNMFFIYLYSYSAVEYAEGTNNFA